MKKNHSQEQILKILQEGESGIKVEDLARKHNIGKSTYHQWKARFSGIDLAILAEFNPRDTPAHPARY